MATKQTAKTETAAPAKARTPKSLKPCLCSLFEFGQYGEDGSAESFESYGTGCTQQTKGTFAQGHDAKLVGFLVRAEMDGKEISKTEGGVKVTFAGSVKTAQTISDALGHKTEYMLDRQQAAANARADREAEKAKAKEEKAAAAKAEQPESTPAPEVKSRPAVTRKSPARRAKTTA